MEERVETMTDFQIKAIINLVSVIADDTFKDSPEKKEFFRKLEQAMSGKFSTGSKEDEE